MHPELEKITRDLPKKVPWIFIGFQNEDQPEHCVVLTGSEIVHYLTVELNGAAVTPPETPLSDLIIWGHAFWTITKDNVPQRRLILLNHIPAENERIDITRRGGRTHSVAWRSDRGRF